VADAACAHTIFGVLVAVSALPIEDHAGYRRAARVLGDEVEDPNSNDVPRPASAARLNQFFTYSQARRNPP
jgi:hypothetical protein